MKMREVGVSHQSVLFDAAAYMNSEECRNAVREYMNAGLTYEDVLERLEAVPDGTMDVISFETLVLAFKGCFEKLEKEERAAKIIPIR